VGEGLGCYSPPSTALQVIIPYLGRGLEGGRDILLIDEPPFGRVMSPHPGKTVGLQLDPDGEPVGSCLISLSLYLLYLVKDTREVLHVMADFMGNGIGSCKVGL
jgi:hypothetical protein